MSSKKLTKRLREVRRNDCVALGAPYMPLWSAIVRNADKPWFGRQVMQKSFAVETLDLSQNAGPLPEVSIRPEEHKRNAATLKILGEGAQQFVVERDLVFLSARRLGRDGPLPPISISRDYGRNCRRRSAAGLSRSTSL